MFRQGEAIASPCTVSGKYPARKALCDTIEQMKQDTTFTKKCLTSVLILCVYLLIRNIPMPWAARFSLPEAPSGVRSFIESTLSGSREQASVFALGLSPYMTASILFQILRAVFFRNSRRLTTVRIRVYTGVLAFGIALFQAILRTEGMVFLPAYSHQAFRVLTVILLIAGSFLTLFLAARNEKAGIGGYSLLILTNVITNLIRSYALSYVTHRQLFFRMLPYLVLVVICVVLFETAEYRVPAHRVMIHNIFSGQDDIAIKGNPAGTMPVMYVMTLFYLPVFLLDVLADRFPGNPRILWWKDNLNLNTLPGVIVYMLLLICLTMLLSVVLLSPSEIASTLKEQGDYISSLHPGGETRRVLGRLIRNASLKSGLLLAALTGIPLLVKVWRGDDASLYMAPMTFVILTGICTGLVQEIGTEKLFRKYRPFL